jgi:hypothetical protein
MKMYKIFVIINILVVVVLAVFVYQNSVLDKLLSQNQAERVDKLQEENDQLAEELRLIRRELEEIEVTPQKIQNVRKVIEQKAANTEPDPERRPSVIQDTGSSYEQRTFENSADLEYFRQVIINNGRVVTDQPRGYREFDYCSAEGKGAVGLAINMTVACPDWLLQNGITVD